VNVDGVMLKMLYRSLNVNYKVAEFKFGLGCVDAVNRSWEVGKICLKLAQKQPPKKGLGDRQVGAFSVFRPRHTGGPFIF